MGNLHMEILQMALPTLFLYVSFGDHLCTVLQGTNLRLEMLGHRCGSRRLPIACSGMGRLTYRFSFSRKQHSKEMAFSAGK